MITTEPKNPNTPTASYDQETSALSNPDRKLVRIKKLIGAGVLDIVKPRKSLNVPYHQVEDDRFDTNYETDDDDINFVDNSVPPDWSNVIRDLHADNNLPIDSISDIDTEEIDTRNDDLVVYEATDPDLAKDEYDRRYTKESVASGKVSPQDALAMLLLISDKFQENMTPELHHQIAEEGVYLADAIGELAQNSHNPSFDLPSIEGLLDLTDVVDIVAAEFPDKVSSVETNIRKIIPFVESSTTPIDTEPITAPIVEALQRYDDIPPQDRKSGALRSLVRKSLGSRIPNDSKHYLEYMQEVQNREEAAENQGPDHTQLVA